MIKLLDWIQMETLDWSWLSENPNSLPILEKNLDKVCWTSLSLNPNAIHLLETNIDKVDWYWLSKNPNIFIYDYEAMKETRDPITSELMAERFHPKHIHQFEDWGFEE